MGGSIFILTLPSTLWREPPHAVPMSPEKCRKPEGLNDGEKVQKSKTQIHNNP